MRPGIYRNWFRGLGLLALLVGESVAAGEQAQQALSDAASPVTLVNPSATQREPVALYSPQKLIHLIQTGQPIVFVDVREPAEFAEDHIPGAINIPRRDLRVRSHEIPMGSVVVPYCNMDFRGFVAVRELQGRGFERVVLMQERGLQGWQGQGLPVAGGRSGVTDHEALEQLRNRSAKDLLGERQVERVEPTAVTRHLRMEVSEWYFAPNELEVNAGDEIHIEITSKQGDHFFILPEYEIQAHIPEGQTREVVFVADRPGTHHFGSCEWDGGALQVMKGRIHVRQAPSPRGLLH